MRLPMQSGALLAAAVFMPAGAPLAQGSAGRETGWFTSAELAAVWTGGNAESNTLGLTIGLRRVWPITEFKLDGGVVRTRSSITTRRAVGTAPDDFQLIEESTTETTAERFFARVRADYTFAQSVFWFGGVDWLRNTFAGIDSRTLVAVGVGVSWLDNDRLRFKTDYGFTFTFENEVVQNPFVRSTFPGSRFTYDFQATITATTAFTSELIADWNLDNTKDLRLEMNNALPVTISSHLALKPSVQLSWRNDPAITNVSLIDPSGTPTGQTVLIPLEKLDTFLRVALVIKI